jgi:hypothetical protein
VIIIVSNTVFLEKSVLVAVQPCFWEKIGIFSLLTILCEMSELQPMLTVETSEGISCKHCVNIYHGVPVSVTRTETRIQSSNLVDFQVHVFLSDEFVCMFTKSQNSNSLHVISQ